MCLKIAHRKHHIDWQLQERKKTTMLRRGGTQFLIGIQKPDLSLSQMQIQQVKIIIRI